jgi:hypothetical protein
MYGLASRTRDTSCRDDDLKAWAQTSNDSSDAARSMQGLPRTFPFLSGSVRSPNIGRGGKVFCGWNLALDVGIPIMPIRTAGPAVTSSASLPSLLTYSQGSRDEGAGEDIAIPGHMRQLEESLVDAVLFSARHTARYCAGTRACLPHCHWPAVIVCRRGRVLSCSRGASLTAPHCVDLVLWSWRKSPLMIDACHGCFSVVLQVRGCGDVRAGVDASPGH